MGDFNSPPLEGADRRMPVGRVAYINKSLVKYLLVKKIKNRDKFSSVGGVRRSREVG